MFTRVTESGGRRYLQIVESFRNDAGKPRLRVVANLGRVDGMKDGQLDALIRGLSRVAGRDEPAKTEIAWEGARSYGDVFALHALWKDLGLDRALGRALRSGRRGTDVEALVRAMVFNRLCDPTSKLGCLRWLETVAMPAMPETVTHQHLLRAMDALMDRAERVEIELARQNPPAGRSRPCRGLLRPDHRAHPRRGRGRGRPARLRHEQGCGRRRAPVRSRRGANRRGSAVDIVARTNGATMSTAHGPSRQRGRDEDLAGHAPDGSRALPDPARHTGGRSRTAELGELPIEAPPVQARWATAN